MRTPKIPSANLLISLCTLVALPAKAQSADREVIPPPWNTYRNVPLGGRTATMGGAGVASGSDSAMPILNPAGLAQIDEHRIAMSASAYSLHAIDTNRYWTRGRMANTESQPFLRDITESMRTQTFQTYPTSFVYSWPMGAPVREAGHHVASVSIVTPRRYDYEWRGQFGFDLGGADYGSLETQSLHQAEYDFGPSYAVQLAPWVRLGVSGLAQYFRQDSTLSHNWRTTEGTSRSESSASVGSTSESWGLLPVLGVQFTPVEGFNLGASVQCRTVHLTGSHSSTLTMRSVASLNEILDDPSASGAEDSMATGSASDYRVLTPSTLTAGMSYEVPGRWAVAADVQYSERLQYLTMNRSVRAAVFTEGRGTEFSESVSQQEVVSNSVWNAAVGGEVFVSRSIALRGGVFTDRSPVPDIRGRVEGDRLRTRAIDLYGGSLGVGLVFGPVDFSIGGVYEAGRGPVAASLDPLNPNDTRLPRATESRLTAVITGGVNFGTAFAPVTELVRDYDTPEELWSDLTSWGKKQQPVPPIPEPLPPIAPPASLQRPTGLPQKETPSVDVAQPLPEVPVKEATASPDAPALGDDGDDSPTPAAPNDPRTVPPAPNLPEPRPYPNP